jgi:hypothetical protein
MRKLVEIAPRGEIPRTKGNLLVGPAVRPCVW